MIRRVVASFALVGVLTGCATFSDGNAVARVDDAELSDELLDDLATVVGPQIDSPNGTGKNADAVRNLITQWLQVEIVQAHLAEIGVDITQDALDSAASAVESDPTLVDVSDGARAYLVDAQAAIDTFNSLPDPQTSFETALDAADIYVDPRYGFFDPQFGILPVGTGLAFDPSL